MYTKIITQNDMNSFLLKTQSFHSSLVKEIHMINAAFVDTDQSMKMNLTYSARVLVQSQRDEPSVTEMIFGNVLSYDFVPDDLEIYSSGGTISKCPKTESPIINFSFDTRIKISSRTLLYRQISGCLGNKSLFGNYVSSNPILSKSDVTNGWAFCSSCTEAWKILAIEGLISCPNCNTSYEHKL